MSWGQARLRTRSWASRSILDPYPRSTARGVPDSKPQALVWSVEQEMALNSEGVRLSIRIKARVSLQGHLSKNIKEVKDEGTACQQREQPVQRSWGRTLLGCGRNIKEACVAGAVSDGERGRRGGLRGDRSRSCIIFWTPLEDLGFPSPTGRWEGCEPGRWRPDSGAHGRPLAAVRRTLGRSTMKTKNPVIKFSRLGAPSCEPEASSLWKRKICTCVEV